MQAATQHKQPRKTILVVGSVVCISVVGLDGMKNVLKESQDLNHEIYYIATAPFLNVQLFFMKSVIQKLRSGKKNEV